MASIFLESWGGKVTASCEHDDADYHGDCSQVKGGAATACSHEPGQPSPCDLMCSYLSANSFFIVSGVSRQHLSELP